MSRMNWTNLLTELFSSGMTQAAIADFCGCGQSTISELARGVTSSPSFELGQNLLRLQAKAKRQKKAA